MNGAKAHSGDLMAQADAAVAALRGRADPASAFAVADVADILNLGRERAYRVVQRMVRSGDAVVFQARSGAMPGLWRLAGSADAVRPRAPVRPSSANECLWAAMPSLGTFSPTTLANHAVLGFPDMTVEMAKAYCRALFDAGYLRVVQRARAGNEATYRLARRSGPKAPHLRQVRAVYDPNDERLTLIGRPS
jgi:hypothetical protein